VQLGTLPVEFRPVVSRLCIVGIVAGLNAGYAQLLIAPTGEIFIRPNLAMEIAAIQASWPLD
jgi:hypothetical protein